MAAVFGGDPLTWEIHAAAYVWECSVEEAEATVARFIQRGLVERRGSAIGCTRCWRTMRPR